MTDAVKKPKKPTRARPSACPCNSGQTYAECCEPVHDGTRLATDAVTAMRARFCALCVGRPDYLWTSLHSQHDDRARGEAALRAAFGAQAAVARFRGFRVLDQRPVDAYGSAQVLFCAEVVQPNRVRTVVELATFVEEEGAFRYILGVTRPAEQLAHDPQDLTIDHWDCGHQHHHH
jgi:SEC-C motif-containing protein